MRDDPAGEVTLRAPAEDERARAFARAVPTLALTQVLGGVGVASGIAVGGILAQDLSGSTSLAGAAQTMSVIGGAALAVPLARLAGRAGRRPALALGYGAGAVGALLVLLSAAVGSFPTLLVGMLLLGGGTASGLQARYAAADAAPPSRRGRALSVVVWATTVGAVAGPNLAGAGGSLARTTGLPPLAGPFLFSLIAFLAAGLLLLARLHPDPLLAGRAVGADGSGPARRPAHPGALEVLRGVRGPRAVLALTTVTVAHAVMVGVMVMTPVHLHDHGASLRVVGVVISVHIAGMYAVSPVFGLLVDRAGREAGIVVGLGLLTASLVVAGLAPDGSHGLLGVALALLGLGWSACLVAGSTLLSESVPDSVRTGVQGVSDLVMGAVAAVAGLGAGPLLAAYGYPSLTAVAGVLLVPVVVLVVRALAVPRAG